MPTIIKKVKWGIANTYKTDDGHLIEINEKLYEPEFENLKNKIISHEFDHTKSKGFWKNRKVDALTELRFRDIFPVYKKYPKLFIQQHTPINYSKEKDTLFFDWSLIFLYMIYAGILFGIYYLIRLFSKDSIFFWTVIKYMAIILGVFFALSFIGKWLKKSINEDADRLINKKPKTAKAKLENLRENLVCT